MSNSVSPQPRQSMPQKRSRPVPRMQGPQGPMQTRQFRKGGPGSGQGYPDAPPAGTYMYMRKHGKDSTKTIIIIVVVAAVLLLVAGFIVLKFQGGGDQNVFQDEELKQAADGQRDSGASRDTTAKNGEDEKPRRPEDDIDLPEAKEHTGEEGTRPDDIAKPDEYNMDRWLKWSPKGKALISKSDEQELKGVINDFVNGWDARTDAYLSAAEKLEKKYKYKAFPYMLDILREKVGLEMGGTESEHAKQLGQEISNITSMVAQKGMAWDGGKFFYEAFQTSTHIKKTICNWLAWWDDNYEMLLSE